MNKINKRSVPADSVVRLVSGHPDGSAFECIILARNSNLLLIQELTDFEPDGIVALPVRWLKGVRNSRVEKCADAVVRHDQTVRALPKRLDFSRAADLKELVTALQERDIWPAVEVIFNERGIVYLGQITKVSATGFRMRSYSAEGKWLRATELDYEEIFKIEIESRYTRHFNSYMRAGSKRL